MISSTFRQRNSGRKQRGAAFVEAIIVSGMLTLFLVSGLFVHRLYAIKLGSIQEARGAAWTQALAGCRPSVDVGNLFGTLVSFGTPGGLGAVSIPDQIGPVGHAQGDAEAQTPAPEQLGAKRYDLGASVQLACNETIQGERGDLLDIALYAAQNFLPSFIF